MKNILYKINKNYPAVSLYGLIFLGISLFISIASIPKKDENHIVLERCLESIEIDDVRANIKFHNDDTKYVFNEFADVTYDVLLTLETNSNVIITLEDDYKDNKYARIKKLEYDNKVIFDSIEHDYQHNINIVNIFAPTTILIVLAYLAILFNSIKTEKVIKREDINKFSCRYILEDNSSFGFIILVFGLGSFSGFLFQYILGNADFSFFVFGFIFLICAVIGIIMILLDTFPIWYKSKRKNQNF